MKGERTKSRAFDQDTLREALKPGGILDQILFHLREIEEFGSLGGARIPLLPVAGNPLQDKLSPVREGGVAWPTKKKAH